MDPGEAARLYQCALEEQRRVVDAGLRDDRDFNGMRGPVPTDFRAHDWQVCGLLRQHAALWRASARRFNR